MWLVAGSDKGGYHVSTYDLLSCGEPEREAHLFTNLSLHKAGSVTTSRHVDKSSPEIARYRIRMLTAAGQLLSVWLHNIYA